MCQYITQKKNSSVWYFRRRIPEEARHLYPKTAGKKPKAEVFFSLKTTDKALAAKRADEEARKLDRLWSMASGRDKDVADPQVSLARLRAAGLAPGDGKIGVDDEGDTLPPIHEFEMSIVGEIEPWEKRKPLSAQDKMTLDILYGAPIPKTLEDAKALYTSMGRGGTEHKGKGQFERAWKLLFEITGNKLVVNLRRSDANKFVQELIAKGVGVETIRKYIAQVSPAIKMAIREFELDCKNPFEALELPNKNEGARHPRLPYSISELRAIHHECRQADDPRRWLIAALSDTGARLSEFLKHQPGQHRRRGCSV